MTPSNDRCKWCSTHDNRCERIEWSRTTIGGRFPGDRVAYIRIAVDRNAPASVQAWDGLAERWTNSMLKATGF